MQIAVLGIDLGKNSCSLAGLDNAGRVAVRRRLRRKSVIEFAASLPVLHRGDMEACCGAHHLGRILRSQGHEVRLMSPEYVRPYVKAQKNDDRDAEAIAEAATRPTMRFVELKSEAQLDMQTLHRARDLNRAGFPGGILAWITRLGGHLHLSVVARFGFGRRHVADGLEQPAVVEPVDPLERGELDGFEGCATARAGGSPRSCRGR